MLRRTTLADRPFSKDLLEKYLHLRPGESREDFSHRVATLLSDDPVNTQLPNRLVERERVYRRLAQLTVDLADYHRLHHAYPDTLAALHSPIDTLDPFANAPFHYTATPDAFTLYSVGPNAIDDHGHEDDLTLPTTQPSP